MNNWVYGNRYLSQAEMENNAAIVAAYFRAAGWTNNAIAALLGNMQAESTINPQVWESFDYGNTSGGYGLTQWTPASKYIEWCGADYETNHDKQLERILYEFNSGIQYYSTDSYPISASAFTHSAETPYYLACAFAWNYERSWVVLYGTEEEKEALRQKRGGYAENWYNFLEGTSSGDCEPNSEMLTGCFFPFYYGELPVNTFWDGFMGKPVEGGSEIPGGGGGEEPPPIIGSKFPVWLLFRIKSNNWRF